jgi:hypothetical protein
MSYSDKFKGQKISLPLVSLTLCFIAVFVLAGGHLALGSFPENVKFGEPVRDLLEEVVYNASAEGTDYIDFKNYGWSVADPYGSSSLGLIVKTITGQENVPVDYSVAIKLQGPSFDDYSVAGGLIIMDANGYEFGTAIGNNVHVLEASLGINGGGSVFGALVDKSFDTYYSEVVAIGNMVFIAATIGNSVYGALSLASSNIYSVISVDGNHVTIHPYSDVTSQGLFHGIVAGGAICSGGIFEQCQPTSGNILGNHVMISPDSKVKWVFGGYHYYGAINEYFGALVHANLVSLSENSEFTKAIGGLIGTGTGTVDRNSVQVAGSKLVSEIVGGEITNSTDSKSIVSGNTVEASIKIIDGYGTVDLNNSNVTGGNIDNGYGTVSKNNVKLNNVTNGGIIAGGTIQESLSLNNIVSENKVIITSSTINNNIAGGIINFGDGTVSKNEVELTSDINDSQVTVIGGLIMISQTSNNQVLNNLVTISGGLIKEFVAGGLINSGFGLIKYNQVKLNQVTVQGNVYGGASFVQSYSMNKEVSGNIVTISGGDVKGVYGGFANSGYVEFKGNQVTLTGDVIVRSFAAGAFLKNGLSQEGYMEGNSVTLQGVNSGDINIYGGLCDSSCKLAVIIRNKITFRGFNDEDISEVKNIINNVYGGYTNDNIGTIGNNTITFESGLNTVKGSTFAGGTLIISGGQNTLVGAVTTGPTGGFTISGGQTEFQSIATAGTAISVSGGQTIFKQAATAGTGINISGGEAIFYQIVQTSTGPIKLSGGKTEFKQNVIAEANQIEISGNGTEVTLSRTDEDLTLTASGFSMNGGTLTFSDKTTAVLNITGNSIAQISKTGKIKFKESTTDTSLHIGKGLNVFDGGLVVFNSEGTLTTPTLTLNEGGEVIFGAYGTLSATNLIVNNLASVKFNQHGTLVGSTSFSLAKGSVVTLLSDGNFESNNLITSDGEIHLGKSILHVYAPGLTFGPNSVLYVELDGDGNGGIVGYTLETVSFSEGSQIVLAGFDTDPLPWIDRILIATKDSTQFTGLDYFDLGPHYAFKVNGEGALMIASLGQGTGEEPGQGTGEEPGQGTGEEPGQGTGEEPGQGTGEEPGQGTGEEPGQGTGEEPGQGTGEEPGQGTGEEPGYQPGDVVQELIDNLIDNVIDEPTPNIQVAVDTINQIAENATTASDLELVNRLGKALYGIGNSGLSPEEAKEALKQLFGESLVNVTASVSTTVLKAQEVILNRLDRVREIQTAGSAAPAAGSGDELNRIWVGGFGIWAKEDASSTVSGYDFSGGGVVLGYDREVDSVTGLRFGISGFYSSGRIKNNNARTTVDLSTVGLAVYGSYLLPSNVFFDASVGYAFTKSDYSTNLYVGGTKTGTFYINSWQFGFRGGYVFEGDNFQIIPSVGIKYTYLRQGAFADNLDAAASGNTVANAYRTKTDHQVDIPVQIRFNTTLRSGSATFTPELRLGYNFAVKKLNNSMNVGFVGSKQTFKINGTRSRGNSFQAGFSLKINTGGRLDAFINYDLDLSKHFRSHTASVGLGFKF